ncbi:hypothetical protein HPP92_003553 [Vanilla planifolia]|uniref:Uncharacterized protein n=1 Tax=Vanilla planifolia TaxID=51239 RepID=A0A835VHB3_VANPL|nr:hypothetical protein HPP92_003553 [Vanilla planifolia]
MANRWSEKSPGLKILWIWTFGTAAILMTNVVMKRLRDMEKMLEEETIQTKADGLVAPTDEILKEE